MIELTNAIHTHIRYTSKQHIQPCVYCFKETQVSIVSFRTEPLASWHHTKSKGNQNKQLVSERCTNCIKPWIGNNMYIASHLLNLSFGEVHYKGVTQQCFFFGNVTEVQRPHSDCKVDAWSSFLFRNPEMCFCPAG